MQSPFLVALTAAAALLGAPSAAPASPTQVSEPGTAPASTVVRPRPAGTRVLPQDGPTNPPGVTPPPPGAQPLTGDTPIQGDTGTPTPGAPPSAGPAQSPQLPPTRTDVAAPHPWSVWWELNKATYVNPKRSVRFGGITPDSAEYFLGIGAVDARTPDAREVSLARVSGAVVPALLADLERGGGPEALVEALLALGRVSPALTREEFAPVAAALTSRVEAGGNRAVVEAALIALGYAEQDSVVPFLARVLTEGRETARARAMAAYALALNARATKREDIRRFAVGALWRCYESADRSEPDVPIACLFGMALVPLDRLVVTDAGGVPEPPSASRVALMRHLGAQLGTRRSMRHDVRAHVAIALGRLVDDLPEERREDLKPWVAEPLLARALGSRREGSDFTRALARSLGAIADGDADPLDERLRDALLALLDDPDTGTRHEALLSLGRVAGRPGHGASPGLAAEALGRRLVQEIERGRGQSRPFAVTGLALAIRDTQQVGRIVPPAWSIALGRALADARAPEELVAASVAVGLARASAYEGLVQAALQRVPAGWERAQVALALGLLEESASRSALREFAAASAQSPRDLGAAAAALVLAGDAAHVRELADALPGANANRARAIAYALGMAGDPRAIDALLDVLRSPGASAATRAAASRSLGRLADRRTVSALEVLATHAVPTAAPSALFTRDALQSAFDESPWPSPLLLGGGILNLLP